MVKIHLYIKRLLEANPMAKIVLYTPYKKVADHVGEVLNEMKLEFITLSGNLKKQNQLLSNFKESGRVILVHDKVGLSGIYLSSATHMLLLHPVGIDEEMRALRMLRNVDTREREVKIVKFITKGTIEEEINEIKR